MRPWDTKFDNSNPDSLEKDAEVHIKNFETDKLGAIDGSGV
jgi:hypothetical protein